MVKRLAAAGLTVTLAEVTAVRPDAEKFRLMVSATLYDKLAKVAFPLTAVTLVAPCKEPVPKSRVALTTVLLSVVTRLPNASRSWMTEAGENAAPAVAEAGGWV